MAKGLDFIYPENSREARPEDNETTWGDYGKSIASGVVGIGEGAAALGEWAGSDNAAAIRQSLKGVSKGIEDSMSPAAQRASDASLWDKGDGGSTVWDEGIWRSLGLKTANALPSLVASIIPAGAVGMGLRAAGFAAKTAGVAAGATAKGAASLMNAGDLTDDIMSRVEAMSEEELYKESATYRGYIELGMQPEGAREQFKRDMIGARPALAATITYLTGGLEGQLGSRVGGAAAKGVWQGVKSGAKHEAGQEFLEGGGNEYLAQDALAAAVNSPMDWERTIETAMQGGIIGAALGGVGGGAGNIGGGSQPATVPATGANAGTASGLGAGANATPPAPPATGANSGAAPTPPVAPGSTSTGNSVPLSPEEEAAKLSKELADLNQKQAGKKRTYKGKPKVEVVAEKGGNEAENAALATASGQTPDQAAAAAAAELKAVNQKLGSLTEPPVAPAAPAPATPQQPTAPEPASDLAAQIAAIGDPSSTKDTVFVSSGNLAELSKIPVDKGLTQILTPEGMIITSNPEKAEAARQGPLTTEKIGQLLDLPDTKANAVASGAPVAVQAKDAEGNVVVEAATAPENVAATSSALEEQAPAGGEVVTTTPEKVIKDRSPVARGMADALYAEAAQLISEGKLNNNVSALRVQFGMGDNRARVVKMALDHNKVAPPAPAPKAPVAPKVAAAPVAAPDVQAILDVAATMQGVTVAEEAPAPKAPAKPKKDAAAKEAERVVKKAAEKVAKDEEKARKKAMRDAAKEAQANAPKVIEITPELKAKYDVAPKVTSEGRRVLGPATDEAIAAAERAAEETAAALDAVQAKKKEATETRSYASKAEEDAAVEENRQAKNLFAEAVPKVLVQLDKKKGPAAKKALLARLDAIIQEAVQKRNVKLANRRAGKHASPELVWLFDVQMMAGKLRGDSATYDEINGFLNDEYSGFKGDWTPMLARRKEVGEQIAVSKPTVDVKAAPAVAPEAASYAAEDKEVTDAVEAADAATSRDETIADDRAAEDDDTDDEVELESDRDEALRVAAEAEAAAAARREEARKQGIPTEVKATRSTAVVTEKKGTRVKLGITPNVGAKTIALRAKLNAKEEVPEAAADFAPVGPALEAMPRRKEIAGEGDNVVYDNSGNQMVPGTQMRIIERHPAGKLLEAILATHTNPNGIVNAKIMALFRARLLKMAGNVEVMVVPEKQLDYFSAAKFGKAANGYWQPVGDKPYIVLSDTVVGTPSLAERILIHEMLHHAFHATIDSNASLLKDINALVVHVRGKMKVTEVEHYGLTNAHEFISEAFTNPKFQELLSKTPAPRWAANQYGLSQSIKSAWDFLVTEIRRAIGMPPGTFTVLDASLRMGDLMFKGYETYAPNHPPMVGSMPSAMPASKGSTFTGNLAQRLVSNVIDTRDKVTVEGGLKLMYLRGLDNIARAADSYFGGADQNPIRRVQETVETIRVAAVRYLRGSEPIVTKLYDMQAKYKGEMWNRFANLSSEANILNVHPDVPFNDTKNAHFGKKSLRSIQAREAHKVMSAEWAKLPPELQQTWHEAVKYYSDQQNIMAFKLLKNRVLNGITTGLAPGQLDALAKRFFGGLETPADIALIGEPVYRALKNVDELHAVKGPYMPQMRRGDFTVSGKIKLPSQVAGAVKLDENTYEFKATKDAAGFANQMWKDDGMKVTIRSVWVDPATGKTFFVDPTAPGGTTKAAGNPQAERRFRATVQNQYFTLHETQNDAAAHAATLDASKFDGLSTEPRRYQPNNKPDMYSEQIRSLMANIEKGRAYKELSDEARNNLVSAISDFSFQMLGATRIQSRRIMRQGVLGASLDLPHNALDYAQSMSGYLAKLDHQPELDNAVADMNRYIENNKYASAEKSAARQAIANEVTKRLNQPPRNALNGFEAGTGRLLTMSFLDKLGSVSSSLVNATQFITNTTPLLASRHGWGKTSAAIADAWSAIGAGKNLGMGVKNTYEGIKNKDGKSVITDIRTRLGKPEYVQLYDYLVKTGSIGQDAGMEVALLIKSQEGGWGKVDKFLSYSERLMRALPEAIEANNRLVTAIATYNLEMASKKNPTHEQAMRAARDMVDRTQFQYSMSNAPTWMNHPLARLTLQFKKFAQGQYQMLGEQVGKAIANENKGDRKEALLALTYWAGTTMVFAGALGLPTEPVKYLLLGLNAAGITDFNYEDFERGVRKAAAGMMGQTLGEMVTKGFTRGLPAGFAFDLSTRMGSDSLTTFGTPKTMDADGAWAWLAKNIAGAPVGLIAERVTGVNDIMSGDYVKGFEKWMPYKYLSDGLRAYRQGTEGKVNERTGKSTSDPYSLPEAGLRLLGLTPARETEEFARNASYFDQKNAQHSERQDLVSHWLNADATSKGNAWKAIQKWNGARPAESRISMGQLTAAAKRRKTEAAAGRIKGGMRTTKYDERFLDEGAIYGVK